MYSYTVVQWVLFFYLYCFIGWVWESCYVSIKSRKWINRGFMHGPFLPIYGSGAVIILIATIPVKNSFLLVFLFGMIAATILEYITGAVMERLFHVRYWDYSNELLNVNGHVCLKCSLVWGAFSILMVKIIHVPFESFLLLLPKTIQEAGTFLLTFYIVADFTVSFNEAMDLRQMLESLTENNEELKRIQKRLDVIAAFADEDMEQLKAAVNEKRETSKERVAVAKAEVSERFENAKENAIESMKYYAAELQYRMEKKRSDKNFELEKKLEEAYKEVHKHHLRLDNMQNEQKLRFSLLPKAYKRAKSIMKRNAIVASKKYAQALQQVKERQEK